MKILFFSPYFYPYISGITISPRRIIDYLSKKNKITVLTFLYDKKLSNPSTSLRESQLTVMRMRYWFRISKGFISPQSILYFIKETTKTDLVILNQPNFEGLFLALTAKMFRKKAISIFHCQVFLEGNLLTKVINFVLNTSMKTQLNLSNKIVVYTKDYIDSLPYFKNLKNKTIEILPPIEKVKEEKSFLDKLIKLKKNNIWVGYAGRISSEKGIEYLVQSINRLYTYYKNIVLIFAGPYGKDVAGEDDYYKKIVELLKKFRIEHMFLGNLTSKQLSSFYKSINMLVLPSINQTEAFGMVQAEAMLAGTPVVASDLPGVRIPIKLTKMGLIVEPKNIDQLSQAIKNILENKNKFTNKKLVKNAQKIFDIKKTYKFYDKILTLIN